MKIKMKIWTLAIIAALATPSAFAANPSGLTGIYGCLTNMNFAPYVAQLTGASTPQTSNILFIINFTSNTLSAISSDTSNWNVSSPANSAQITTSASFAETATSIAGIYTETIGGNPASAFNIVPVNSGNTLLVSQAASSTAKPPQTGVCQKQ